MVVDENQANVIRGWHDIEKDNITWMNKAIKYILSKVKYFSNFVFRRFYDGIAERAAKNGHAIDIWGCALDQVLLLEILKFKF